jgi:hypothetical protein
VLLEEGCTEFSNIHGLGQIRFPKGNIGAAFEEVRRVLEREDVLPPGRMRSAARSHDLPLRLGGQEGRQLARIVEHVEHVRDRATGSLLKA